MVPLPCSHKPLLWLPSACPQLLSSGYKVLHSLTLPVFSASSLTTCCRDLARLNYFQFLLGSMSGLSSHQASAHSVLSAWNRHHLSSFPADYSYLASYLGFHFFQRPSLIHPSSPIWTWSPHCPLYLSSDSIHLLYLRGPWRAESGSVVPNFVHRISHTEVLKYLLSECRIWGNISGAPEC